MEWSIQRTTRFDNRYKKLAKKHRNECQNALDNFNRYFEGLREGGKPAQLSVHSFVHNEAKGLTPSTNQVNSRRRQRFGFTSFPMR